MKETRRSRFMWALLLAGAAMGLGSTIVQSITGSGISNYITGWNNSTDVTYVNATFNNTTVNYNTILMEQGSRVCTTANALCGSGNGTGNTSSNLNNFAIPRWNGTDLINSSIQERNATTIDFYNARLTINASGHLAAQNGTVATPGYTFLGDTNTGMYATADTLMFATGGARRGYFVSQGFATDVTGTALLPSLYFGIETTDNTGFYRIAEDQIGVTAGGIMRWNITNESTTSFANVTFTGNITVQELNVVNGTGAVGTTACSGKTTLSAGVAVVNTNCISVNAIVLVTSQADGGSIGSERVSARNSTSFTISSSNVLDTSVVGWLVINK